MKLRALVKNNPRTATFTRVGAVDRDWDAPAQGTIMAEDGLNSFMTGPDEQGRFELGDGGAPTLLQRLGARTVVAATVRAIQLLGRQFVLGRNIQEAMREADDARAQQRQLRFSYDMLGEGARTDADAQRYLAAYHGAIAAIGAQGRAASPESGRRRRLDGFVNLGRWINC